MSNLPTFTEPFKRTDSHDWSDFTIKKSAIAPLLWGGAAVLEQSTHCKDSEPTPQIPLAQQLFGDTRTTNWAQGPREMLRLLRSTLRSQDISKLTTCEAEKYIFLSLFRIRKYTNPIADFYDAERQNNNFKSLDGQSLSQAIFNLVSAERIEKILAEIREYATPTEEEIVDKNRLAELRASTLAKNRA